MVTDSHHGGKFEVERVFYNGKELSLKGAISDRMPVTILKIEKPLEVHGLKDVIVVRIKDILIQRNTPGGFPFYFIKDGDSFRRISFD